MSHLNTAKCATHFYSRTFEISWEACPIPGLRNRSPSPCLVQYMLGMAVPEGHSSEGTAMLHQAAPLETEGKTGVDNSLKKTRKLG